MAKVYEGPSSRHCLEQVRFGDQLIHSMCKALAVVSLYKEDLVDREFCR